MIKIKEFFIVKWKIIAPLILFFIFFILMNFYFKNSYDDKIFYSYLDSFGGLNLKSIFSFLRYRYDTWTSRLAVEFFLVILVRFPILFRILNTILATCLVSFLLVKFDFKNVLLNVFLVTLLLLVDYAIYKEVGITSTCLNYLWPFAFCALALWVSYKNINNNKTNIVLQIVSIFLLIFMGLWTELTAIICLIFFLYSVIYYFIKNKKIDIFSAICFTLSLGFMIFAIICPGNAARLHSKGQVDISKLSFFMKVNRGVMYSFRGLFNYRNPLVYMFIIFLPIYSILFKRNLSIKICSFVPVVTFTIYTCLYLIPNDLYKNYIFNVNGLNWLSIVIMCLIYLDIIYVILFSKNSFWNTSTLTIIFLSSLLTAMTLGFSPNITNHRTYFYITMFQIIAVAYYSKEIFTYFKTMLQ